MLEVRSLSARYGQHRALEDVSVTVAPGEIVVILGANGAGKSTLLKAISGICEGHVTGEVTLRGEPLSGLSPDRIVEAGVALVPEGRGIFGDLSVEENLTLGAYSPRAREEEAANLDRVYRLFPKLTERRRQVARTMSGGEQQMVAIGRAMMSNPAILTLDEPSLGLSPVLCKELFGNLAAVRDLGIGVLLVEQNARQSLAIADRGYLLENAHIVHQDTAAALRDDPAVQAAYLGAGASQTGAAGTAADDTARPADDRSADIKPVRPHGAPKRGVSADALLGRSVADLVSGAAKRQSKTVDAARVSAPPPSDRITAMLAEIEAAAKRARTVTRVERPIPRRPPSSRPARPDPHVPAGPASSSVSGAAPVIEVYRRPRVEVWRRRPGTTDYERD